MNDLLTTREAADKLGVHVSTISRWVKDKRIAPADMILGAFFFNPADIAALADELERTESGVQSA